VSGDTFGPLPVTISAARGAITSLSLSVADPTEVGAAVTSLHSTTATIALTPISSGSNLVNRNLTTITATDQLGRSVSIGFFEGLCGRPEPLRSATLIYPKPGATGVPLSTRLYFAANFIGLPSPGGPQNAPNTYLHLIVGAHQTLEGGQLQPTAPPPNVSLPTAPTGPGLSTVYLSVAAPALVPGTVYQTQVYDDFCQAPELAGGFST
jgi:hypothetical protein